MLYFLVQPNQLIPLISGIHSIAFRALAGLLGSLLLSVFFGGWFIKKGSNILSIARKYTPKSLSNNENPPTMGGVFLVAAVISNVLLWSNLSDPLVLILIFCIVYFAAVGAWDDWHKIKKGIGISSKIKFLLQLIGAGFTYLLFSFTPYATTTVTFPFFKTVRPDLGWLFIVWFIFVLVGTSNAVNLTDGLDGLAISSLIPNFMIFSLLSYLAGNATIASYLHIPFAGTNEVAIIASMLVGASLGFLWYNAYPAQIVMGDAGSLALGATLGLIALITKQELLLVLSGGLFVVETGSVILQVACYKLVGKRIFRMAPIHHHFEFLGWPESKITVRFSIISIILCLLALTTLKTP